MTASKTQSDRTADNQTETLLDVTVYEHPNRIGVKLVDHGDEYEYIVHGHTDTESWTNSDPVPEDIVRDDLSNLLGAERAIGNTPGLDVKTNERDYDLDDL